MIKQYEKKKLRNSEDQKKEEVAFDISIGAKPTRNSI